MKKISLQFIGNGKRTNFVDMHGFEGPAKNNLFDGNDYVKRGQITGAFCLEIPPSGKCEVVDTQHNRVRLRTLTLPSTRWELQETYDPKENKWVKEDKKVKSPPAFKVLDDTPIEKDLPDPHARAESKEVAALKKKLAAKDAKIKALEDAPPPGSIDVPQEKKTELPPDAPPDITPTEGYPVPNVNPQDEIDLELEDQGPPPEEQVETKAQRNARVFANKVEPTG